MINATQTPYVTGFQIGGCALFDRCATAYRRLTKAVPSAMFDRCREAYRRLPEPYLDRRFTSGSEGCVGLGRVA